MTPVTIRTQADADRLVPPLLRAGGGSVEGKHQCP